MELLLQLIGQGRDLVDGQRAVIQPDLVDLSIQAFRILVPPVADIDRRFGADQTVVIQRLDVAAVNGAKQLPIYIDVGSTIFVDIDDVVPYARFWAESRSVRQ